MRRPRRARARVSDTTVSTGVSAIAEQVAAARARGNALRLVSGGTWLDAGRACTAADRLELGALTGIVRTSPATSH